MLANMGDERVAAVLAVAGAATASLRRLDDQTAFMAASDPETFRRMAEPANIASGVVTLDLSPFAFVTLDIAMTLA
ncbi:MAG: hypothetical protein H0T18_08065 [Chloroflexia bacterium]|nr:hypothetical protein [Chloroflexia bacterium]